MPSRARLQVAFFLIGKKAFATKSHYTLLSSLILAVAFVGFKDSFALAFQLYIFLFPHIFLFLSQDMFKDEIGSGALENVLFLRGNYKPYLFMKNLCLGLIALVLSLAIYLVMAFSALIIKQSLALPWLSFLIGILVGVYYIFLGGLLSFYVRAGSNVLIIILGQVLLLVGLFLSVTQRAGFIDQLSQAHFPGILAKIKFLVLVLVFPNIVVAGRFHVYSLGVAGMAALLLLFQKLRLQGLELREK